jgi:hypothetical protein
LLTAHAGTVSNMSENAISPPSDAMSGTDIPDWQRTVVRLKFVLGEFCLAKISTEASADQRHYTHRTTTLPSTEEITNLLRDTPLVACMSQPVVEQLPVVSWFPGMIRYVPRRYSRYYVALNGKYEDYLRKFSSRSRGNLNRRIKKIEELCGGKKYFYEYRRPEEIKEFCWMAREVSRLTYQEKLLHVGLPDTAAFRENMSRLAVEGRVRGYLLIHNDKPIAYAVCSVHGSRVTSEEVGYDPSFKNWSPGTVLWLKVIETFFAEKTMDQFDFGGGEAEYKAFFSTGSATCADVYFFRRDLRNSMVVITHYALETLSFSLVRLLERWHVKELAKKTIRRWATGGR